MNTIAQKQLKTMVLPLLSWYEKTARVLPWRSQPTPYRVWISEIMLQQTRVEAVKPYFDRFVNRLPDVKSLADISEEELLKLWEGLGYYSRAKNLKKAAQTIVDRYNGKLPSSYGQLLTLPGIGPYSAGAIASIAFGQGVAAVDGNVLRVLARLAASEEDITAPKLKKTATQKIEEILPSTRCGDFNQALMELGAMICLPGGKPKCEICPLTFLCDGYQMEVAESLPVRSPKRERRQEEKTVLVMIYNNWCALQRRQEKGLLAGMWEFPCLTGTIEPDGIKEQLKIWGISHDHIMKLPSAKHLFTHIQWNMTGYLIKCSSDGGDDFVWSSKEEMMMQYALPSAFRTYYRAAIKNLT
jgi:A/G-specific adenine glycosylase